MQDLRSNEPVYEMIRPALHTKTCSKKGQYSCGQHINQRNVEYWDPGFVYTVIWLTKHTSILTQIHLWLSNILLFFL